MLSFEQVCDLVYNEIPSSEDGVEVYDVSKETGIAIRRVRNAFLKLESEGYVETWLAPASTSERIAARWGARSRYARRTGSKRPVKDKEPSPTPSSDWDWDGLEPA